MAADQPPRSVEVRPEVAHTRGPDQRPGPMRAVGVVRHVKRDSAGPVSEIERLFRIHGQVGDAALIVQRVNQPAVADGHIVRV